MSCAKITRLLGLFILTHLPDACDMHFDQEEQRKNCKNSKFLTHKLTKIANRIKL
jgi:hypothetical protein